MSKKNYTPMMQHYLQLKEENPESILFYRLGDFYEMFFDDAKTASQELDLVLTGRAAGVEEKVPMCGIPFHAANVYIQRLIKKGYKVAICEQLSDPSASKGLVERGIVKIITPGTYMDQALDAKTSNFIASVAISGYEIVVIYGELSTGELKYQNIERSLVSLQKALLEQEVKEVICPMNTDKKWKQALEEMDFVISYQKKSELQSENQNLLPPSPSEGTICALSQMMAYLKETQKQTIDHFMPMISMDKDDHLILDSQTKNHLELVKSRGKSLWEFMDHCKSAMGSRLLKRWIEMPLQDIVEIQKRQQAIQILIDDFMLKEQLNDHLSFVYDMERLASRMAYGNASPRDVLQLVSTIEHAQPILSLSEKLICYPEFQNVPTCQGLYEQIYNAIVEQPPLTLKEGGVFRDGYNAQLDELRQMSDQGKQFILELEAKERERTGIKSLKIGYNRVFGYYIDVRNGNLGNIKEEFGYQPKQTLANSTRFITAQLKEKEEQILHAQDAKVALEQQLFKELLGTIKCYLFDLHALAKVLAKIDVLVSLATLAIDKGYVCPKFHDQISVNIIEGKHPILDDQMKKKKYVSNNWIMPEDTNIQLITGPNMGGKSTYMRQNALLVIMAQMGSFIPCKEASLPIFDRIFTRIGASDDILSGKSTFMVEMLEANVALRYATNRSLILFDEIGRGTATYDGMALAQAMLEYINEALKAKTLFSTHYHELTSLEEHHSSIVNIHVDVKEKKDEVEFRYRLIEGKADKSYGINVARLAHLPKVVLDRASQLLLDFESQGVSQDYQPSLFVMDTIEPQKSKLLESLHHLDIDSLSPREALDYLYEIKKMADECED